MLILSRVQFAGVELSLKIGCNIINSLFFFIGPQGSVLIMQGTSKRGMFKHNLIYRANNFIDKSGSVST